MEDIFSHKQMEWPSPVLDYTLKYFDTLQSPASCDIATDSETGVVWFSKYGALCVVLYVEKEGMPDTH